MENIYKRIILLPESPQPAPPLAVTLFWGKGLKIDFALMEIYPPVPPFNEVLKLLRQLLGNPSAEIVEPTIVNSNVLMTILPPPNKY